MSSDFGGDILGDDLPPTSPPKRGSRSKDAAPAVQRVQLKASARSRDDADLGFEAPVAAIPAAASPTPAVEPKREARSFDAPPIDDAAPTGRRPRQDGSRDRDPRDRDPRDRDTRDRDTRDRDPRDREPRDRDTRDRDRRGHDAGEREASDERGSRGRRERGPGEVPQDRGAGPDERPRDDRGPRRDDRSSRFEEREPRREDRGPRDDERRPRHGDRGPRTDERRDEREQRPEHRGPRGDDRFRADDRPRRDERAPRHDPRGPRRDARAPRGEREPDRFPGEAGGEREGRARPPRFERGPREDRHPESARVEPQVAPGKTAEPTAPDAPVGDASTGATARTPAAAAQRLAVFLDVDALTHEARELGGQLSFSRLLRQLTGQRSLRRAIAYCSSGTRGTAGVGGLETVAVDRQGDAPVAIAVDALATAQKVDCIVVAPAAAAAGPLVRALRAHGVRVESAGFAARAASTEVADHVRLGRESIFVP